MPGILAPGLEADLRSAAQLEERPERIARGFSEKDYRDLEAQNQRLIATKEVPWPSSHPACCKHCIRVR